MPTLKEYNVKLNRLRNTQKMTKTMKMVSANKLRKAREAMRLGAQFGARVDALLAEAAAGMAPPGSHPLLERRAPVGDVLVLVVTSDRGLCGGFNHNVVRAVTRWRAACAAPCRRVFLSFHGERGRLALRQEPNIRKVYPGASARPLFRDTQAIGRDLRRLFLSRAFDEVFLAYNVFKSVLTQTAAVERLLPMEPLPAPAADPSAAPAGSDVLFEPAAWDVAEALLETRFLLRLHGALLGSAAGEHGARMSAMENSTRNADTLIETCAAQRNRARQAAITRELTEIVAGAEALK